MSLARLEEIENAARTLVAEHNTQSARNLLGLICDQAQDWRSYDRQLAKRLAELPAASVAPAALGERDIRFLADLRGHPYVLEFARYLHDRSAWLMKNGSAAERRMLMPIQIVVDWIERA